MSVELAYKTTSPRAIDWFYDLTARRNEIHAKRRVYEEKQLELYGPMGSRLNHEHLKDGEDRRPLITSRFAAEGLACRIDEEPPEKSGWRLDAKTKWWLPKLATGAGRARAAELRQLSLPNTPKEGQKALGVPAVFFHGDHLWSPGYAFRAEAQELYVVWGGYVCHEAMDGLEHSGDSWMPVTMDEWHAWREEVEAVAK